MVDGSRLERNYKDNLSDFRQWSQIGHAADWMLLPQNMGVRLSIDETSLCDDLFTILSNKDGHGRKGTVIAMVRGTRCGDVSEQLMKIPVEQRLAVTEVTMDFSDSMYAIVRKCFPNATIVIDCFHIVRRCGEAVEELRLKAKRQAQKEQRKLQAEHRKKQAARVKPRKAYRKKHPKKYKGRIRGRKPARLNSRYTPETLSNGDTKVELLTRSRNLLTKSPDKWSDTQKERARLVFDNFPVIKEAFTVINSLRAIFRNKNIDRNEAKTALHSWYDKVSQCTIREVKSARDAIKAMEEEVLNYFINRSTNASAESLNSKLKGFRSQLHGVSDLPFFMYRISRIFG